MKFAIVGPFLDENKKLGIGGAERYVRMLAVLLSGHGHNVTIYQKASLNYQLSWGKNVIVKALRAPESIWGDFMFNCKLASTLKRDKPNLVIYANMLLAFPYTFQPSIAIQHGIWWDRVGMSAVRRKAAGYLVALLTRRFNKTIAVDTNFPNWVRACYPRLAELGSIVYIPNCSDLTSAMPTPPITDIEGRQSVRILFPRRFEKARGTVMFAKVARGIVKRGYQVQFHFVGNGVRKRWLQDFVNSTELCDVSKIYELPPDQMASAYEKADIVVIPSLAAEGTSLACLEAMSFGKPIVATTVGGLANLIINGFNGLLVEPTESSLTEAIVFLLEHPNKREELGRNAWLTARAFTKDIWADRIMNTILDVLRSG